MELDLCDECYWRGSVLLTASVVMPLMVEDPRGFHVLRAGAQGLFLLLLNGVQRGGRPDIQAIRDKGLIDLLGSDPDGVLGAARTLGLAQNDAIRLVEAVLNSEWRRALALRLEARAFIRALLSPRPLASRLAFRARAFRKCPVIRATREGRRTPDDIDWWLQAASDSHSVVWARAK